MKFVIPFKLGDKFPNIDQKPEKISFKDDTLHLSFDLLEVQARKEFQNRAQTKTQTNLSDSSQILRGKMREMLSIKGRTMDVDEKGPTNPFNSIPIEHEPNSDLRKRLRESENNTNFKKQISNRYVSGEKPEIEYKNGSKETPKMKKEEGIMTTKRNKSPSTLILPPAITELLNKYKISNVIKGRDLEEFLIRDPESLTPLEECSINEKIIELLADKIITEKENRLQTEIQIEKLTNQNMKQISALERMIKKTYAHD